ncbi:MAG: magnesium transporter [Myxococcales bacterium]|nr:magnesium transporter [Myxococcales bacterium]MDH5565801.1 magnesium transporter [Myxococcales bacterium]
MARRADAVRALARIQMERHPDEAAQLLETSNDEDSAALLAGESTERASQIIARLTPDRAARILFALSDDGARRVIQRLEPQRVATLLARMDAEERESRLALLAPALAAELRELASYPADTAGSLMDPRVTTFRPDGTVRDVVRRLRRFRNRRIQDVFLVDEEGKLIASVSLQDVVLAKPGSPLEELARHPTPRVSALASREEVHEMLERHHVASLPVVDFDGHLLGVLRQSELIIAAREDATADAVKMVGASENERALSSPLFAVRKRLPWLQVNLLTAFVAAAVVGLFETTIARVTALAVLLPVVAGQSGNTGAQALAVTMRGLALREIRMRHWWRVAVKESAAGLINGVAVALTTAAAVFLWSRSPGLALVIGVSMILSMAAAGLAGALIPITLTALRQDPAQSSSIILTTVTDVTGFFSFLGIATLLVRVL